MKSVLPNNNGDRDSVDVSRQRLSTHASYVNLADIADDFSPSRLVRREYRSDSANDRGIPRVAPVEEPEASSGRTHGADKSVDALINRHGLTRALADAITEKTPIARDGGGTLYRYHGGVYKPDGDDFVVSETQRLLARWDRSAKWSAHRASEVRKYIATQAPTLREKPPLDVLNVQNGLVRLTDSEPIHQNHSPDYLSSVQLPVRFQPSARCPKFDTFLEEILSDENAREFVFEMIGYLMTPDTSLEVAFLFVGDGANGKSTLIDLIKQLLGKHNTSSVRLHDLDGNRFAAAVLIGKLANFSPDISAQRLPGTSTFKGITGEDEIFVERKNQQGFSTHLHARLVFACNTVPDTPDHSHGYLRRWIRVPFTQRFEPGKCRPRHELIAELMDSEELSGLLNKAIKGYQTLKKRGRFSLPTLAAENYQPSPTTDDLIRTWFDSKTTLDTDAYESAKDLLQSCNTFLGTHNMQGVSKKTLGSALKRYRPTVEQKQKIIEGKRVRRYFGISLA